MASHLAPVDVSSPPSIAGAKFTSARRGYDRDEVRALLDAVAAELARTREDNDRLAGELADVRSAGSVPLDEETVTILLGEEAARVLTTARESAGEIRRKAEENAARLLREAQDDAARVREEAALDVARQRDDAAAIAAAEIEAAKEEGRSMVLEARAVRERMLGDLTRRRDTARAQVERLRAERGRLLAAFLDAGRMADDVATRLREAAPGAELPTVDEVASIVATETEPDDDGLALAYAGELGPELEPQADHMDNGDGSGSSATVEDLFARLRAANPAQLATEEDKEPKVPDDEPAAAEVFDARSAALEPIQLSLGRRLKRVLTDQQNDVLDALRRAKGAFDAAELLGPADAAAERFRVAAENDLWRAGVAGVRSVDTSGATDSVLKERLSSQEIIEGCLDQVVADLAGPFRSRLEQCVDHAGGDAVEVGASVRAAFREWKTQRVDELAGQFVLAAHGGGAFAALEAGTPIRWVVDPDGPQCPDADDNALAGVVATGEPFPTGHCHAPAHPGCRCGIVVTQG
jgi:DivIVA domain-containing protein